MKSIFETLGNALNPASGNYTEFAKATLTDANYSELKKQVESCAERGPGIYMIQTDVDVFILIVRVRIVIKSSHTIGGSDDRGNYEEVCLSTIKADVLPGPEAPITGYFCIDEDLNAVECDFDVKRFEKMF
ncbi:MAG: hypothetical protein ACLFQA_00270 [Bacteroidales bacterium]